MKKIFYILFVLCVSLNSACMDWSIENLTMDQKIRQMFIIPVVTDEAKSQVVMQKKPYRMDKEYIDELIHTEQPGGLIIFGISDLEQQKECIRHFQSISAIPLLIGQDLEPGRVGAAHLPYDCNFPSNKESGITNDTEHTKTIAQSIGKLCKTLGVHLNFAPVADVNNNPNNPVINDRSFGDNPELVTKHAIAFADGLAEQGILSCAKHFPGHGDTDIDSHLDLPVINQNLERLNDIELYPFKQLIAHGIPTIMIGHLCIPALESEKNLPATFSKAIVTDLLQKQLGFSGLIITDALEMKAISDRYSIGEAAVRSIIAGNDILLCPIDIAVAVQAIKQAIVNGIITEEEINKHVEKIMHIKQKIFVHQ